MPVNVRVLGTPRVVVHSIQAALRSRGGRDDGPWTITADAPEPDPAPGAAPDLHPDDDPDVIVVVSLGAAVPPEIDLSRHRFPDARLVWLAGDPKGGEVAEAVSRGCSTVITQRNGLDDLVMGVERASHGESWTTPDMVGELLDELRRPEVSPAGELSRREVEVLTLLREGRSTPEVAERLYISPHTTKNHVRRILRKLGAHSRLEAVALAERRGLLPAAHRSPDG